MGTAIFAASVTHERMPRSKLTLVIFMLLAAALLATAGPAFAHGPHEHAVFSSLELRESDVDRSGIADFGAVAVPQLEVPAGAVWVTAA
ncbi:MAG: hypothetical protein ACREIP_16160, partial [Alphaproteobacteria bacterium]